MIKRLNLWWKGERSCLVTVSVKKYYNTIALNLLLETDEALDLDEDTKLNEMLLDRLLDSLLERLLESSLERLLERLLEKLCRTLLDTELEQASGNEEQLGSVGGEVITGGDEVVVGFAVAGPAE